MKGSSQNAPLAGKGVKSIPGPLSDMLQVTLRMNAFVEKHHLDVHAQELLMQLDAATLETVMAGFQPKSEYVSAEFIGFVNVVLSGVVAAPVLTLLPAVPATGEMTDVDNEVVNAFVSLWALDDQAKKTLMRLDRLTQQKVIQEFAPHNPRNVSAAFMNFVKAMTAVGASNWGQGASSGSKGGTALGAFADSSTWGGFKKWNEIEPSRKMLKGGKPCAFFASGRCQNGDSCRFRHVLDEEEDDPNGILGLGVTVPPPPIGNLEVDDFVARWGLDSQAQSLLMALTPDARFKVLTEFNPPATIRNMPAFFTKYAKTFLTGIDVKPPDNVPVESGDPQVDEFVAKWGLDREVQKLLLNMEHEPKQKVINAFHPPAGTRDVSALFMGFAKGHLRAIANDGKESVQGRSVVTVYTGIPEIDNFVEQWGLRDQDQRLLVDLDPDTRQKIMAGFAPPENAKNIPAMFMAFAKSIANATGTMPVSHSNNRVAPYPALALPVLGKGLDTTTLGLDAATLEALNMLQGLQNPVGIFGGLSLQQLTALTQVGQIGLGQPSASPFGL